MSAKIIYLPLIIPVARQIHYYNGCTAFDRTCNSSEKDYQYKEKPKVFNGKHNLIGVLP